MRFVTEKPWPGLIDRMAATDFLPMPPKMLKEQGVQALVAKPTGTGPFKFVQWVRDERLVLEKNPDYWKGAADLNRRSRSATSPSSAPGSPRSSPARSTS